MNNGASNPIHSTSAARSKQLFRLSSQTPNPVIKVAHSVEMNRVSPENRARWNLVKNAVTFTLGSKRKREDVKKEDEEECDRVGEVIPPLPVPLRRRASTRRSSIINLMRENSEEREANDIRRTLNSALHRNSFYQLPGSIFVDEYDPENTRNGIGSGGSRKYSK